MIKRWSLSNFKSVRRGTALEFGALTIFAGANSSGKSTMIQAILMLCQTLASKVQSRSVVLNGHMLKLGSFADLRSFRSESPTITVGAELEPSPLVDPRPGLTSRSQYLFPSRGVTSLRRVSLEVSFDAEPVGDLPREILQLQPRLLSSTISTVTVSQDGTEAEGSISVTRARLRADDKLRQLHLEDLAPFPPGALDYDVALDSGSLDDLRETIYSTEPVGCILNHFLPASLLIRVDAKEEAAKFLTEAITDLRTRQHPYFRNMPIPSEVMKLISTQLGELFPAVLRQRTLFDADEVDLITVQEWLGLPFRYDQRIRAREKLRELAPRIRDLLAAGGPRHEMRFTRLPDNVVQGVEYLNSVFASSVKYLGPLREEPKPLYPIVGSADPADVGMKGEYTAAVLDLHRNVPVRYIPPEHLDGRGPAERRVSKSLQRAVLDWLQYMDVVHELTTRDLGKLGHDVKVKISATDAPHDITHVGVGVSQILPIVVMCLLAPEDSIVVLEQPELHLHPKVQTRLGDFLISMSLAGRQCIVETHSEYLINRVRLRIAKAAEESLASLVRIYFVEKTDEGSRYVSVAVNRYGAVQDWPTGFFDESQREAEEIIRAGIGKRKNERRPRDGA